MEWIFITMLALVLWFIERQFGDANLRIEALKYRIEEIGKKAGLDCIGHVRKKIADVKAVLTLVFEGKDVPKDLIEKSLKDMDEVVELIEKSAT